jgi:hypothetical protein
VSVLKLDIFLPKVLKSSCGGTEPEDISGLARRVSIKQHGNFPASIS